MVSVTHSLGIASEFGKEPLDPNNNINNYIFLCVGPIIDLVLLIIFNE